MTTKLQVSQDTLLYPEILALSLVDYANENEEYKNYLESKLTEVKKSTSFKADFKGKMNVLAPRNLEVAIQRTDWLLKEFASTEVQGILTSVMDDNPRQDPQAIVLGLILGVAPIGVMGHDKPGSKITQVVREDVQSSTEIISGATKTSLRLLERAIAEARGELKRIEPDMADWFFGEKKLDFFKASQQVIESIIVDLEELQVPYATFKDDKGISALSVSPAINPESASLVWDIAPIDQNTA